MVQRNLVTFLAAFGGILVILGGVLGFLLSLGPRGFGPRFEGAFGALVMGTVAVLFGLVILVFSGYTQYRGVDRSVTGGLVLFVLGAVTWVVVGEWVLVALGSFLTVLAGIVLMAQRMMTDPHVRPTPAS